MTTDGIAALVTAVGLALAGLIAAVVSLRKQIAEARAKAADDDAKAKAAEAERATKRDDALVSGMERLVTTLQGALDTTIARADASREKHTECLELVGEMSGRIEALEVSSRRTEVALEDCQRRDRETRIKLAQLDRRTSDPNTPKVTP